MQTVCSPEDTHSHLLMCHLFALPAASNAPTASPIPKTTAEDTPVDLNLAGSTSDTDVGDSLVLSIQTPAQHGAVAQRVTPTGTMVAVHT